MLQVTANHHCPHAPWSPPLRLPLHDRHASTLLRMHMPTNCTQSTHTTCNTRANPSTTQGPPSPHLKVSLARLTSPNTSQSTAPSGALTPWRTPGLSGRRKGLVASSSDSRLGTVGCPCCRAEAKARRRGRGVSRQRSPQSAGTGALVGNTQLASKHGTGAVQPGTWVHKNSSQAPLCDMLDHQVVAIPLSKPIPPPHLLPRGVDRLGPLLQLLIVGVHTHSKACIALSVLMRAVHSGGPWEHLELAQRGPHGLRISLKQAAAAQGKQCVACKSNGVVVTHGSGYSQRVCLQVGASANSWVVSQGAACGGWGCMASTAGKVGRIGLKTSPAVASCSAQHDAMCPVPPPLQLHPLDTSRQDRRPTAEQGFRLWEPE